MTIGRTILAALSAMLTALLGLASWFEPFLLIHTAMALAVTIGLAVTGKRYGAADRSKPGASWQKTEERFFEDGSGQWITVWCDPQSGTRHYLTDDAQ